MQDSLLLLQQVKGYSPKSDVHRFKDFIGSDLHLDFKNEVVARILQIQDTYANVDVCNSKEDMFRNQGGIVALELVLNIFENLLSNKESDLKFEENRDVEEIE